MQQFVLCKQTLNRNAISRTHRGRARNHLFFFSEQMFGPPAPAKEVFSPEETVRHVKQRRGHLGGGISSASCDHALNYNGDPRWPAPKQNVSQMLLEIMVWEGWRPGQIKVFAGRFNLGKAPLKFHNVSRNYYAASEDNAPGYWFATAALMDPTITRRRGFNPIWKTTSVVIVFVGNI